MCFYKLLHNWMQQCLEYHELVCTLMLSDPNEDYLALDKSLKDVDCFLKWCITLHNRGYTSDQCFLPKVPLLTHWARSKMSSILQTEITNEFFNEKNSISIRSWLKFVPDCPIANKVTGTDNGPAPHRRQVIFWIYENCAIRPQTVNWNFDTHKELEDLLEDVLHAVMSP